MEMDKTDDMGYYTFTLDKNNLVVIAKYDNEKWSIVNKKLDASLAKFLGGIIDDIK